MGIGTSIDLQARCVAVSLSTMLAAGIVVVATPALSQGAMGPGAAPMAPQQRVAPAPSAPVATPQMPMVTPGAVTPPAPAALKNKAFFEKEEIKPGMTKGATAVIGAASKLLSPPDGALVGGPDSKAPIAFRWTPLVPRPQEPPTYRLRVWQLMQGQNASQAMQERQPVVTVDVDDLTNTSIPSPGCALKACSFVWTIQALNRDGKPVGQTNGTSDPSIFRVAGAAASLR